LFAKLNPRFDFFLVQRLSFSILAQGHWGQSYSVADLFGLTEGWRPLKMESVAGLVGKL